jgi:hypothetical protein
MSVYRRMMERMYEDINLTDELMDNEAKLLLDWGSSEHEKLEAQSVDLDTLEDRAKQIRKTIKRINRFVGQRSAYADDEAQSKLQSLTESLYDLGYTVSQEKANAFLAAQKDMDNTTALQAMLDLLKTEGTDADTTNTQSATGLSARNIPEQPTENVEARNEETGTKAALQAMRGLLNAIDPNADNTDNRPAEDADNAEKI